MAIGSGCKVHLREEVLPTGRLIASVSRHLAAAVDGVIHDTHSCSRDGMRCVYGYWSRTSLQTGLPLPSCVRHDSHSRLVESERAPSSNCVSDLLANRAPRNILACRSSARVVQVP